MARKSEHYKQNGEEEQTCRQTAHKYAYWLHSAVSDRLDYTTHIMLQRQDCHQAPIEFATVRLAARLEPAICDRNERQNSQANKCRDNLRR